MREGTEGSLPVSKWIERDGRVSVSSGEISLGARPLVGALPERELVASCRTGDGEAFARLVRLHEAMVVNLASRLLGDVEEARDVTQEVFLRVYERLAAFEGRSSLKTWIYRIAVNLCHNRRRFWHRRGRDREHPLDERLLQAPVLPGSGPASASPYDETLRLERARRVQAALLELRFEQRSVLVLREIEGLTCEEVAVALGVPEGTVKSRLSRAREALRVKLSGLYDAGGAS
jgi:RNA polymerase sigma-70 factor (ECF subfamily)